MGSETGSSSSIFPFLDLVCLLPIFKVLCSAPFPTPTVKSAKGRALSVVFPIAGLPTDFLKHGKCSTLCCPIRWPSVPIELLPGGSTRKTLDVSYRRQGFVLPVVGNCGTYLNKECFDGERGGLRFYWLVALMMPWANYDLDHGPWF